jgi:simple sugar transport system permease protein
MRLVLERRAERSTVAAIASPLIAIALTLVTMTLLFTLLGKNPLAALWVYFIDPITDAYSLQEIAVKATPLVMIALGLSLCYLANVWNIGAEGQFLIGAVAGSWHRCRALGAARHARARRARRRALCARPRDLQGEVRRQRNSYQPDAGLCRRSYS